MRTVKSPGTGPQGTGAAVGRSLRGVLRFDRRFLRIAPSARLTLPFAAALVAGSVTGHMGVGLAIAVGALLVGLTDQGGPTRPAVATMLAAAGLVAAGNLTGSLAANGQAAVICAVAVWAFGCAVLAARGPEGASAGLVGTLAFLLVTEQPLDLADAIEQSAWVLAGGAAQALQRAVGWPSDPAAPPPAPFEDERALGVRRGVLLGIALSVAVASYSLPSAGGHAYWVATTALFILRPGFGSIAESALARYLGTVLALGIATAAVAAADPGDGVLIALGVAAAFAGFSVLGVSFALFTASLSSVLVFLAPLGGISLEAAAVDYMFDATLGAAIAMAAYALLAAGALGERLRLVRPG